MSETNPCCHDCDFTDGDDPTLETGCCAPMPVRRDCGAPELPVRECSETEPTITFDEETEEFVVTSELFDSTCSALLDSTGSTLFGKLA
jgi:hypothetical protein